MILTISSRVQLLHPSKLELSSLPSLPFQMGILFFLGWVLWEVGNIPTYHARKWTWLAERLKLRHWKIDFFFPPTSKSLLDCKLVLWKDLRGQVDGSQYHYLPERMIRIHSNLKHDQIWNLCISGVCYLEFFTDFPDNLRNIAAILPGSSALSRLHSSFGWKRTRLTNHQLEVWGPLIKGFSTHEVTHLSVSRLGIHQNP